MIFPSAGERIALSPAGMVLSGSRKKLITNTVSREKNQAQADIPKIHKKTEILRRGTDENETFPNYGDPQM